MYKSILLLYNIILAQVRGKSPINANQEEKVFGTKTKKLEVHY